MNDTCPACDGALRPGARTCRCGWVAPEIEKPQINIQRHIHDKLEADKARLRASGDEYLKRNGLDRQAGESSDEWRKRLMAWMKDRASRIGRAA